MNEDELQLKYVEGFLDALEWAVNQIQPLHQTQHHVMTQGLLEEFLIRTRAMIASINVNLDEQKGV